MKTFSTLLKPLAMTVLISWHSVGLATTVTYELQNLSGNTWQYTYTIENDTLGVNIEEFTIYFDVGLFENLAVANTPIDWDPLVVQPDSGLPVPDDGFYDALALSVGIAPGGSLSGFEVQFDYLGGDSPGSQFFEVIDPNSFVTLDSGLTQAVPLPAAAWLFISGMVGLAGLGRRRRPAHY
jgi:hypothetical protein